MSETPETIAATLQGLLEPGSRGRLLARGVARGLVWRKGAMPEDGQAFSPTLSEDLLDHGYAILTLALRLRETGQARELTDRSLLTAAESIESVVRRGDPADPMRGFHLVVVAAAYHIAGYAARSFCLLPVPLDQLNLASSERALAFLMRRSFRSLREHCIAWLRAPEHLDDTVAARLRDDDDPDIDGLVSLALGRNFHRALATLEFALWTGEHAFFEDALRLLRAGVEGAAKAKSLPYWWQFTLATHLAQELWADSLHERLPKDLGPAGEEAQARWQEIRRDYIDRLAASDPASVDLWPSQREAAGRAADAADDLVVALPTSAGKTRVAELCILRALADSRRAVYVTPLRALSAQIERKLAGVFRPLGFTVSSMYGASGVSKADIASLGGGDIVVATPEKLDFALRQQPTLLDDVGVVVLDEGHMIGVSAREVRYEVLVQRLLAREDADERRIVCLSAIFGENDTFADFTAWIRSDAPGAPVRSPWRPTRQRAAVLRWNAGVARGTLRFLADEAPFVPRFVEAAPPGKGQRKKQFPDNDQELAWAAVKALAAEDHRVLLYSPRRDSVETAANAALKLYRQGFLPTFLGKNADLSEAEAIGAEWLGLDHVALKAMRLGIAVHHGGLPRPFLREIELLLDRGALNVLIASPTLAQGLDLSCGALVFWSLYRGAETKTSGGAQYTVGKPLPIEEFANVIGRAGRAYVDLDGLTLLPVFKGNKKEEDFRDLWAKVGSRELESGLLLLVNALIRRIAAAVGNTAAAVLEYVANRESTWSLGPDEKIEGDIVERPTEELVADLDAAIIASVEDLDCTVETMGAALDAALKSSLWQRRVAKKSEQIQSLQTAIIKGRAQWLWDKTNGAQRRAIFSAGIGHATSTRIETHLDEMLDQVANLEVGIQSADVEAAALAVVALARTLFTVPPFAPDEKLLFEGWEGALTAWFKGEPLAGIISKYGAEAADFIQDAVVYRLVWGVEAVRVYGQAMGHLLASSLEGAGAVALTFGVPSREAAIMLQAGLMSRRIGLRVLAAVGGYFADFAAMVTWAEAADERIREGNILDPEGHDARTWKRFLTTLGPAQKFTWARRAVAVTLAPLPGEAGIGAHDGLPLRVIRENAAGVPSIARADGTVIARIETALAKSDLDGYALCRMADTPTTATVELFSQE